ncbi:MAG: amino acid racemase [Clostridia bacterium]|nr:amino acid racemase [Clostridia bacterium]
MDSQKNKPLLGVLGGLGPMSSVYFYELLTSHTKADRDQGHIDLLISSRATTPDRTAYILGTSDQSPLPAMKQERDRLVGAGATLLVIPCNTAHTFYEELQRDCPVPILNIIEKTVGHLTEQGVEKFGLLATEGTVRSGSYQYFCNGSKTECLIPTKEEQALITSLIYDEIKQNRTPDLSKLYTVAHALIARGAQRLVLGCTELSLLKKHSLDDQIFLDSLDVLAYHTVLSCGKEPIGFEEEFMASSKGGPA